MMKARLVKRQAVMAEQRVAPASTPKVSATSVNLQALLQQFNRRPSIRPLNPREAFAALFARPQTS